MNIHPRYLKKGLVQGPLDFPCTEDQARNLETQLKESEKEGLGYRRAFCTKAATEFEEGERADISVITDSSLDLDHEVVIPQGIDLDEYRKNPMVMFGHDSTQLPVGRNAWIKASGDSLKAKTVYAPRPEGFEGSFFPEQVWELVKSGFLPGKSIGFIAQQAGYATEKELETRPELKGARIIRRATLYEYSCVAVPCNPSALAEQIAKGLDVPEWMQAQLGLKGLETLVESCIIWGAEDYLSETKKTFPMPRFSQDLDSVKAQVLDKIKARKRIK